MAEPASLHAGMYALLCFGPYPGLPIILTPVPPAYADYTDSAPPPSIYDSYDSYSSYEPTAQPLPPAPPAVYVSSGPPPPSLYSTPPAPPVPIFTMVSMGCCGICVCLVKNYQTHFNSSPVADGLMSVCRCRRQYFTHQCPRPAFPQRLFTYSRRRSCSHHQPQCCRLPRHR